MISSRRSRTARDVSFSSYAVASEDRDLIGSAVVADSARAAQAMAFTRYDDAMNLITFVQSVPYVDDHPTGARITRWRRWPRHRGTARTSPCWRRRCCREAGFDVALLKFPGHRTLALGINVDATGTSYEYNGVRYFYVEMTAGLGHRRGAGRAEDGRSHGPARY